MNRKERGNPVPRSDLIGGDNQNPTPKQTVKFKIQNLYK